MPRVAPSLQCWERSSCPQRSRRYADNAQRMATLLAPITGGWEGGLLSLKVDDHRPLCVSVLSPSLASPDACMSAPPLTYAACFLSSATC